MGFRLEEHTEITQVQTRQDTSLGIMRWGTNNTFPQTLKNMVEQSPTAKPAVERTAKFLKGSDFKGSSTIVSPYGLTLKQAVAIMADDYALFRAFALQCNFNLNGQVTGINPMRITDLRFNEFDELNVASKLGYHENFGRNSEVKKTITNTVTRDKIKWIDRFNPGMVLAQAETAGGLQKYNGQILYHSDSGFSSYPIPPLQSSVNYVLADIENSILMRKESSTGFVDVYLLKTTMDSEDPTLIALEDAIAEAQGSRGSGGVITMSGLDPEALSGTLLEPIGAGGRQNSIIESSAQANELIKSVIQGSMLIPPVLAGNSENNGFSEPNLRDAYFVFNSVTKEGRDTIESELNRVLEISVFDVKSVSLNKLNLDSDEDQGESEPETTEK